MQFASEPRVELPLQAIETGAFQACVAELARPPSAIVPTWLCDSAQVCRAHCRIFKGASGRYVLFPHVLAWAGTRLSRPIEVCEEAHTYSRMRHTPAWADWKGRHYDSLGLEYGRKRPRARRGA